MNWNFDLAVIQARVELTVSLKFNHKFLVNTNKELWFIVYTLMS